MQSVEEQINDRLASRFYKQSPAILARVLQELGIEAAVRLLQRDDLCCPLECFLVEVGGLMFPARVGSDEDLCSSSLLVGFERCCCMPPNPGLRLHIVLRLTKLLRSMTRFYSLLPDPCCRWWQPSPLSFPMPP